ncbi:MAG: hypothetical protein LBL24_05015 [Bacteroidales bacterium]|jgi:hypothetical protein|nr:hypothetical protein [Bacteroidales bacterium]
MNTNNSSGRPVCISITGIILSAKEVADLLNYKRTINYYLVPGIQEANELVSFDLYDHRSGVGDVVVVSQYNSNIKVNQYKYIFVIDPEGIDQTKVKDLSNDHVLSYVIRCEDFQEVKKIGWTERDAYSYEVVDDYSDDLNIVYTWFDDGYEKSMIKSLARDRYVKSGWDC